MTFIDPFNNVDTIGQGTLAKEILNQSSNDSITFDYLFALLVVEV